METRDALLEVAAIDPVLVDAVESFESEYGDDIPIVAFGEIGDVFVDNLEKLDSDTITNFFEKVEELISCGIDSVETAIATGLIEALISRAERTGLPKERIPDLLGPQSLAYLRAWNELHGIPNS